MNPTVNVQISLAPFGSVHVEFGKIAPHVETPLASPAREPVYYLAMLNTDTWIYEAPYQTPTPMYEAPHSTIQPDGTALLHQSAGSPMPR
ncbi:MAG TPA: hypothetical protein VHR15_12400 [Ktedonobacterales bacterium]|nr:hypothetical protein [Ktedonobacterales bacterium]